MGPKLEKTTFCSKRSVLGGSGAEGEGGAEGVEAAGLEYLSSSGCSSLGKAEKSGELCRDETAQKENRITAASQIPHSLPLPRGTSGRALVRGRGSPVSCPSSATISVSRMSALPPPLTIKWEERRVPAQKGRVEGRVRRSIIWWGSPIFNLNQFKKQMRALVGLGQWIECRSMD